MSSVISFLHTSPVHIPTFTALLQQVMPGAVADHVVDEDLLRDARAQGPDTPVIVNRVQAAVRSAAASGASVVVCTCSTIGAAAEATPSEGHFTAMRIDRAMADAAVQAGPLVLVVAALESTMSPTSALVKDSARRLGLTTHVAELLVPGAWEEFERGHTAKYYRAIELAVRAALPGPTVVVLAQASMAPALSLLQDAGVPVLASPELGVRAALQVAAVLPNPSFANHSIKS